MLISTDLKVTLIRCLIVSRSEMQKSVMEKEMTEE